LADIFQEVDEEVRRDRALDFMRRYGSWLLSGAVAIVALAAGYTAWQQYNRNRHEQASARFDTAVSEVRGDKPKARASFETLTADAPQPYAGLAQLRIAALEAETGDRAKAAALYGTASGELSQPELRDLAQYLAVLERFDVAPPEESRAALTTLAGPGRPMRAPAQELLATLALRGGDVATARSLWKSLMDDITTPAAMRQRAADMLAFLPGDKK